MLHGMRHVRRLNQVLNDNCGLSIDSILRILLDTPTARRCGLGKGLVPAIVAELFEFLVDNVSGLIVRAKENTV